MKWRGGGEKVEDKKTSFFSRETTHMIPWLGTRDKKKFENPLSKALNKPHFVTIDVYPTRIPFTISTLIHGTVLLHVQVPYSPTFRIASSHLFPEFYKQFSNIEKKKVRKNPPPPIIKHKRSTSALIHINIKLNALLTVQELNHIN